MKQLEEYEGLGLPSKFGSVVLFAIMAGSRE